MFPPEYLAIIDPFSDEAKKLVAGSGPYEGLPPEIAELAANRVKWSHKEMVVKPDPASVRADVLSFYLMCQGLASVSFPGSREAQLVSRSTRDTVRYRMYDLFRKGQAETCMRATRRTIKLEELDKIGLDIPQEDLYKLRDLELGNDGLEIVDERILPQYQPKYAVRWIDLAPLLKRGQLQLTDLYLKKGWAVVTSRDLWDFFASVIAARTEDYLQWVYERMMETGAGPSPVLAGVGEKISSLLPKEPAARISAQQAGKLVPEAFPPCIRQALAGVGEGLRNYAVMVMLAPFLSYTRIAPSGKPATKIADFITDISVVKDEIAPLVFGAAANCNPPLFKDQPQEKAGVFYHMGFGMTAEPKLADSGRSKWYRTPNCAKIQVSAPSLCRPDEACRGVKNPVTYYFRRRREVSRNGGGPE